MKSLRTEVLLNQFAELHIVIYNQNLIRDPLSGRVAPRLHAAQFTRFGLLRLPFAGIACANYLCRVGIPSLAGTSMHVMARSATGMIFEEPDRSRRPIGNHPI